MEQEQDSKKIIELSRQDQIALQEFLTKKNGQNVVAYLYSQIPCGSGAMNIDEAALAGQRALGFKMAIEELENIVNLRIKTK